MDWVREHYSRQSEAFGRAGISARHRQAAELIDRLVERPDAGRRALELGAGACGLAGAMVGLGYDVTAIEFNPTDLALGRTLERDESCAGLRVLEGDFYEVDAGSDYDLVYYWDGFGVGSDDDQRRLLRRVAEEWLRPAGVLLLDVFSPWNWIRRHGERSVLSGTDGRRWNRRVEFDAVA